jgi:hypothetical protein
MRNLVIDEVSLVDRGAQEGANVVIRKSKDDSVEKARFAAITSSVDGHSHLIEQTTYQYNVANNVLAGTTTYAAKEDAATSHSHPWMMDAEGKVVLGEADGHTHEVDAAAMLVAMRGYLTGLAMEAAANKRADVNKNQPADSVGDGTGEPAALDAGDNEAVGHDGATEHEMGDVPAAVKAASSSGDATRVADLEKRLARAEAYGQLDDAGKRYAKSLGDVERKAFLAKSSADRAAEIAKAADADPVVFTAADGSQFRKSDDPRLVSAVRRADEESKVAKQARDRAEGLELAKRAEVEIPNLPGSPVVKAALLKAVDGIADEAVRKDALAAIVAGSNGLAPALRTIGKRGTGTTGTDSEQSGGDPEAKLDELAKARASKDGIPYAKAYREVLRTTEGARLYGQVVGEEVA